MQIITLNIISLFPEFVEKHYSNGIYPYISHFSRTITGWIPFSIGDVLYFITGFFIIRWFYRKRGTWKLQWKDHLLRIISCFSIFYFLFNLLWAGNYHRVKLYNKMQMESEYTDAELLDFTKRIIGKTNEIHLTIAKNDRAKIVMPYSREEIFNMSLKGYDNLAAKYPYFKYENASVKKSIISLPLTYMGFGGYLNPFTNESQVNDMLPMYTIPTTTAHEMAHQIGYASESEANFVGYLAAINNDDLYIQYSGYALATRYCLGIMEVRNEELCKQLLATVNPGIRENFRESRDFWEKYETFIEKGFKVFYDNFLKINQQKDGLDSYSRFVDLMVNYYKTNPV
ncbi:MAG TPA: DUF3810 domain-containing protein [Flavobacterium sp.]